MTSECSHEATSTSYCMPNSSVHITGHACAQPYWLQTGIQLPQKVCKFLICYEINLSGR